MKTTNLLGVCVAVACCGAGTASAAQERGESKNERARVVRYERKSDRGKDRAKAGDSYFHRHGYTRLDIPKGHYPPPGECRIWYPDRPPGHQLPPTRCERLPRQVPPGAWVIRHQADDPDHVHVVVYDERRSGSVLVVGQFEIATGVFVRVVVDR
jgi:hypothetical protein